MKIKTPKPVEAYEETEVCDKCGDEAYQDERLISFALGEFPIIVHQSNCYSAVLENIKTMLGLKHLQSPVRFR